MGNKLFENIGNKIMGVVKFFFYANVTLVTVTLAIVSILALSDDVEEGLLVLVIGAVIGALYLLFVYLGMLCVYGFGELVQCNIEQRNLLRIIAGKKPIEVDPVMETKPASGSAKKMRDDDPISAPVHTAYKADGKSVCPHCGARQPEGTEKCKYCGTAMK